MTKDKYNVFRLPNGLNCIHARIDTEVSYCGVVIGAGSRDESCDKDGLAHFVEHTLFKGTDKRKSYHINSRMERVGGDLNAYTSKEETLLYTAAPAGYTERSLELMADLIGCSRFPSRELEKERCVVIDEINSYLDSPDEAVFDEFEELIYSGSRMAHNILGTSESVAGLTPADCREFLDRYYTPGNMALYIVDNSPHTTSERLAYKHFGALHYPTRLNGRKTPDFAPEFHITKERSGHQAHTLLGARIVNRTDPRRFALFLMNNYLGGSCMNSRLNVEMREKRGLVYTVESSLALMSDCGTMQIYFGCDPKDTQKCARIALKEIDKLAQAPMKSGVFRSIQRQYVGQLAVASAHRESIAASLGKGLLYYGKVCDVENMTRSIENVTPTDLQEAAQLVLQSGFSSLTLT